MLRRSFLAGSLLVPLAKSVPLAEASCGQRPGLLFGPPPAQLEPKAPPVAELWYEKPVSIGLQKRLLVDDFALSHRSNINRDSSRATKVDHPVVVLDKSWEQANMIQVGSVFRDGARFRMYYGGRDGFCCYAESDDGLQWTKPNLSIYEFQGNKNNNLIDRMGATCFLDTHETDPAHKYKSCYAGADLTAPYLERAARLAHSADGLRWTAYNQGAPVTYRASDTLNQLLWDEAAQVYRLYTRTDFGTGGGDTEKRGTRDMINPDLKAEPTNWTTMRNWIFDRLGPSETNRRQFMCVNDWIYEGIHFGLFSVHEWPASGVPPRVRIANDPQRPERDVVNMYIAPRREGYSEGYPHDWNTVWIYAQKPLLPRGPDSSFDKGMVVWTSSIITWTDRHWIYYTGWPGGNMSIPYEPAIGLATLRLDGFVFLEPWVKEEGWIITKPFMLEGNWLEVNADARKGWVAAEVLNGMGDSIAGLSYKETKRLEGTDGIRLQILEEKRDQLATLRGSVVRLKFHLQNARLYAFQIKA